MDCLVAVAMVSKIGRIKEILTLVNKKKSPLTAEHVFWIDAFFALMDLHKKNISNLDPEARPVVKTQMIKLRDGFMQLRSSDAPMYINKCNDIIDFIDKTSY